VGAVLLARPWACRATRTTTPQLLLTAPSKPAIVLGGRHRASGEATTQYSLCMGAWRPAVRFDRRLQRYNQPLADSVLARIFAWRWRRIPDSTNCGRDSSTNARSYADAEADPGSASGPGVNGQFRKRAAVGPTWPGCDSNREDSPEHGVLYPGRI